MKISGFYEESISNGLGWRAVLFVSGCPHHCPGCHNKAAQDFNYGEAFDDTEILDKIKNNSILKGVTISGGEPLCKENIGEVYKFIKKVKKIRPELNIWCYSGYTFEELLNRRDKDTDDCLEEIDVLVDGKFEQNLKDPSLKFRGSSNQKIWNVKQTLMTHKFIPFEV